MKKMTNEEKLFLAIKNDDLQMFEAAFTAGVNVNTIKDYAKTPLHFCGGAGGASYGKDFAKVLLDAGANLEARDAGGRTPLILSAFNNKTSDILKFLLEEKADVNAVDNEGETPLHKAINYSNNYKIMEILLEEGADVNATDKQGNTPLHIATGEGCRGIKVISMLLDAGADPGAKNKNGETPCEIGCRNPYYQHMEQQDALEKLKEATEQGATRHAESEIPVPIS